VALKTLMRKHPRELISSLSNSSTQNIGERSLRFTFFSTSSDKEAQDINLL